MRVLIPLIDFGRGGGYRVLSRLASEWSRSVDVYFLAPDFAAEPYFPTEAKIIHVSAQGRATSRATRELAGMSRVARAQTALTLGLRRNVRRGDVILSNHFLTTLAANAATRSGVTHVRLMQATEADYYPGSTPRARFYRLLARRADARAPYVLVNSPEFLVGDQRRLGVIPPGIDRQLFFPPDVAHVGPPVVGTIGREEPWKGTDRVLAALRMCDLPSGTTISVANFGADLEPFRDLPISESQPESDAELARWYQGLTLYVVGAYGQPGAYHYPCLEALSCGVPLVAPWYRPADSTNSWLVESTEPELLTGVIMQALANLDERTRRRNEGLYVAEDHSWPALASSALQLVRQAVHRQLGDEP